MKTSELRRKFLQYFQAQEHVVVPSSSLVPDNDPSVLLTTAGMQQFKPFFLGEKNPEQSFKSRRLTSIQRCFRTSDIDEVGDESHLTFFEMLGNFSVGDYSKDGAIRMAWECATKVFKLPKQRIWATIFAGDQQAVKDFEAVKLWQAYLPAERIAEFGRSENWWGPPGATGPCGPCSEIHIDRTGQACVRGKNCKPNCDCGRFLEIWNLVFMEYFQDADGKFSALPTKNVDTGMGLERLASISQKKQSVFETDVFVPILKHVDLSSPPGLQETEPEKTRRSRIVADHLKGATFLISDGVRFSNKDQGYILRRVFRRALDHLTYPLDAYPKVVEAVIGVYADSYPGLKDQQAVILDTMKVEAEAYDRLVKSMLEAVKQRQAKHGQHGKQLSADEAFELYSTHGVPLDRLRREGFSFNQAELDKRIEQHRQTSRAGVTGKFGGHGLGYALDSTGLNETDVQRVTRLHTATHLLHAALRRVLGNQVQQNGSDITPERLRFDFTHSTKLTPEELQTIEKLVNEQVQRDLPVSWQEVSLQQALASGAMSFFRERYPDKVKVYTMGDFSKEICGGPHVEHTAQVGHFKITSEKSSAAGIRRIKATVEA